MSSFHFDGRNKLRISWGFNNQVVKGIKEKKWQSRSKAEEDRRLKTEQIPPDSKISRVSLTVRPSVGPSDSAGSDSSWEPSVLFPQNWSMSSPLPMRWQSTEAHEIPEAKKYARLGKLMMLSRPQEAQQVRRHASHGPLLWFPLCYWDKHYHPKATWRRQVQLTLPDRSSPLREVNAGNRGKNLEPKPWRNTAYWFAFWNTPGLSAKERHCPKGDCGLGQQSTIKILLHIDKIYRLI